VVGEGIPPDEAEYQEWCASNERPVNVEAHLSVLRWVGIVSAIEIGLDAALVVGCGHLHGNRAATQTLQTCYRFVMTDPLLSAGLVASIHQRFPVPANATEVERVVSKAARVAQAARGNWAKAMMGEALDDASGRVPEVEVGDSGRANDDELECLTESAVAAAVASSTLAALASRSSTP
jgi:hypothetical protein